MGQNPSDGESAVLKNAAIRAVKSRQAIIQTATDLQGMKNLEVGQEGCTHYRRKFIYVDSGTEKVGAKLQKEDKDKYAEWLVTHEPDCDKNHDGSWEHGADLCCNYVGTV
ncbi:hypothetical protein ElyMa_000660200 [Elysia marginata]|uniref:Uncharacterized protein n=1 Tax=Elysia marginata TaxID=1093978 RepID=A0AAV4GH16_9GAST|nr:hypothetical protein ElyMa_000660200 [Elysia marginata]